MSERFRRGFRSVGSMAVGDTAGMGSARTPGKRGPTSRRGGEPVALGPPAGGRSAQLGLGLVGAPPRSTLLPRPGVVQIPDWLDLDAQRALVAEFREWAPPPAGLRHPRVPTGHLMSTQAVCLGWHWSPYAYSRTADDTDGAP